MRNAAYFETELTSTTAGTNSVALNQLIVDMLDYAKALEKEKGIPPADSLPQKPKPEGSKVEMFEARINEQAGGMSTEVEALLRALLTYIDLLERR